MKKMLFVVSCAICLVACVASKQTKDLSVTDTVSVPVALDLGVAKCADVCK